MIVLSTGLVGATRAKPDHDSIEESRCFCRDGVSGIRLDIVATQPFEVGADSEMDFVLSSRKGRATQQGFVTATISVGARRDELLAMFPVDAVNGQLDVCSGFAVGGIQCMGGQVAMEMLLVG